MLYFFLILSFIGTLSSGSMISMLLLLVSSYLSTSLWLISHGLIYSGLLYVLVYVGAIVVLIMFVVQLTNTSLIGEKYEISTWLLLIQNTILLICLTLLIVNSYFLINNDLLLNLSYLNLTEVINNPTTNLTTNLWYYLDSTINNTNLSVLAYSIFNEYGYILLISIHAIILAIIGPIKLAISDQTKSS